MAFSFSKIINKASSTVQEFASVAPITRGTSRQGLPGDTVGKFTTEMNNVRVALGSDLSKGTDVISQYANYGQGRSFVQRGELDVFNPQRLDSLVSSTQDIANVARASSSIAQAIQGVSNRGSINLNSGLSSLTKATNTLGAISNVASTLSRVSSQFTSTTNSIQSKLSSLSGFNINSLNTLVSGFGDISSLVQNVVTVVPRDIGELVGAVGGQFDSIRQLAEQVRDTSGIAGDFLDLNFRSPWDTDLVSGSGVTTSTSSGSSKSRIPNPLREAVSWNYIITLGILDDNEFNFPSSYRNSDFTRNYIVKSGGGKLDKRYKTYLEGNEDAEYYIENLELDSVIAPNRATNVALGTTLGFEVVEPYSMGQFIEAIIGSAAELNYANYTDAPFCLKIEFLGWDEYGEAAGIFSEPVYIPILITKIDFTVTGKGAVYTVQGVPLSETGLDDKIQTSNSMINAVGQKAYEVLNGDEKSIQAVFNERVQELEQAGTVISEDRYIIAFPKTPDAIPNLVNQSGGAAAGSDSLTVDAPEQQRREKGLATPDIDRSTEIKQEGIEDNSVSSPSPLFNTLKAFASDIGSMNEIGLSNLVIDTNAPGDHPQGEQEAAYQEDMDIVDISSSEAAPAEKGRSYQFQQGETITDMITKILLDTEYAKERATEESTNGTRKWFRIDTQVFIDNNPAATAQRGRSPKIYVYSILDYYPDEAKFLGPTARPKNTEGLKALAPKEYNYFYTGYNEDVLNFDITFNNAFFLSAFANYGQNSASIALDGANRTTFQNSDVQRGSEVEVAGGGANREPGAQIKETNNVRYSSGSVSGDMKQRIAEQFHENLINSPADMVTAEMEIWGDPFFLPQQTGNFSGTPTGNPNVLAEATMNYLQNEVLCVVNFKTPFDYQVEGATMEFPQTVPQFSGLYNIWAVNNVFQAGQFKQNLKLIRRRGQDDPPAGSSNSISPNDDNNIKDTTDSTLGANGGSAAAGNSVNSTAGAADPCQTTAPTELGQAVSNITDSPEELLMSMPVFNDKSTTAGDDVVFSQPVVQVGDFAWTPNQNVFGSAPRAEKVPVGYNAGQIDPSLARAAAIQTAQPNLQQESIVVKNRPSGPSGARNPDYQYSDAYLRRQAKRARNRGDSGSSSRGGRRG